MKNKKVWVVLEHDAVDTYLIGVYASKKQGIKAAENAIYNNWTFVTEINKTPAGVELYTPDDNCYYEIIGSPVEE